MQKIPTGYKIGYGGYLRSDPEEKRMERMVMETVMVMVMAPMVTLMVMVAVMVAATEEAVNMTSSAFGKQISNRNFLSPVGV